MILKRKTKDAEGTGRKRGRLRLIIGVTLIVLVTVFTLTVTVVMRRRIGAADEVTRPLLERGLRNDLVVCAGMMIVALGITFSTFTKSGHIAVRIVGYTVWGIGILITAEALLMSGKVLFDMLKRDAAPEAPYTVVVGMPLKNDNDAPAELSARMGAAAGWWKDHRETTLIVTGKGEAKAAAASGKSKYAPAGVNMEKMKNTRRTEVEATAYMLADAMIPVLREDDRKAKEEAGITVEAAEEEDIFEAEDADTAEAEAEKKAREAEEEKFRNAALALIRKVGESEDTEQALRNLLATDYIDADTPIVLVTSNYDMPGAMRIAEKVGFTNVTRLPAAADFWEFGANLLWEIWQQYDPGVQPPKEEEAV